MKDNMLYQQLVLVVKVLGIVPLLIALFWLISGSSTILLSFVSVVGVLVLAAHYFSGYRIAKWLVGLFTIGYCGFQSYVFFSLLGTSSLSFIYLSLFVILFINGLVLLLSKQIANSFANDKQKLSSERTKRLKLLLWLLVAMISGFLIVDVLRLLV